MQNGALYDGRSPFDLSAASATPATAAATATPLQAATIPAAKSPAKPVPSTAATTAIPASRHAIPATIAAGAASLDGSSAVDECASPVGAPLSWHVPPPEGLAGEERREVHVPWRRGWWGRSGIADDGIRGELLPPAGTWDEQ